MKFLWIFFLLVGANVFGQVPKPDPSGPLKKETPEEIIYDIVDEPAQFPGGQSAMLKFFADHLKYPERAKELNLEGKSYIQFVVTEKGNITNPKVKKGVPDCPECDKEAIRLVLSMPKWKPGKIDGKPVKSHMIVLVKFILD